MGYWAYWSFFQALDKLDPVAFMFLLNVLWKILDKVVIQLKE